MRFFTLFGIRDKVGETNPNEFSGSAEQTIAFMGIILMTTGWQCLLWQSITASTYSLWCKFLDMI